MKRAVPGFDSGPSFPGAAVGGVDAEALSSGAVGSAHDPRGHHIAAQPVGATPVPEGCEQPQAWPQCVQIVSQQQPQHQLCTQSILDIPNAHVVAS